MANRMMKLSNAIFKPLLSSRFHFLVSSGLMLITVTGRKTGKFYTTPVSYQREGNTVYFFSDQHLTWTKNLRGGAHVKLLLKGQEVPGNAAPCVDDESTRQRMLKRMYPYMSADKSTDLMLFRVGLGEVAAMIMDIVR